MTRTKAEAAENPHPTTAAKDRHVRYTGKDPGGMYSYAAMIVRDLGSALIEEYGDQDDSEDEPGPTDADHARETARLKGDASDATQA